jgi:arginine decarboxylase
MKKMMKDKVSEKIQYFESLSNPIRYVPTAMFFTKGIGIHKDQLTSFELALRDAKISDLNLVTVSSINPQDVKLLVSKKEEIIFYPGKSLSL